MTIFTETDHPRAATGTFTEKRQGLPEIGLSVSAADLPEYDPMFFYDRAQAHNQLRMVHAADQSPVIQAGIRNATQAVNDSWAAENDAPYGRGNPSQWVETTVFEDGDYIVADIQHKDPTEQPYGSLVVFGRDGKIVSAFDNVTDNFGERWVKPGGLRAQMLTDLEEASAAGELGDQL